MRRNEMAARLVDALTEELESARALADALTDEIALLRARNARHQARERELTEHCKFLDEALAVATTR